MGDTSYRDELMRNAFLRWGQGYNHWNYDPPSAPSVPATPPGPFSPPIPPHMPPAVVFAMNHVQRVDDSQISLSDVLSHHPGFGQFLFFLVLISCIPFLIPLCCCCWEAYRENLFFWVLDFDVVSERPGLRMYTMKMASAKMRTQMASNNRAETLRAEVRSSSMSLQDVSTRRKPTPEASELSAPQAIGIDVLLEDSHSASRIRLPHDVPGL